ncbi:MAG: hypothetical protein VKL42_21400 [Snowella sp.]|nr:hypothetical protein [Snowella sp.]
MTNSNETEKNISHAQEGLNSLKDTLDFLMKNAERAGKWGKPTAAAAFGLGGGLLIGVGIVTTLPVPNEFKPVVVSASGLAGMGGAVFIVIEVDERRKKIQEEQRLERLQESRTYTLEMLNKYPNLESSLRPKLDYDSQTESVLLRGDSIGAVQALPWGNNSPSNPQQNTLSPAPDTENPA